MDFTKVTVYTGDENVDLVTSVLYDMGITGVQIMDKNDFAEFMQNNLRAWDVVDEELVSSVMNEKTSVTFYLENDGAAPEAKKKIETETKLEAYPPSALSKAEAVSAAPFSPEERSPEARITSAVTVHITVVSKNTSITPQKPCRTAESV